MKLRWIFLVAILGTLAAGALGVAVALLVPASPDWVMFVASLSAMSLLLIPLFAGLATATLIFDPDTADGRRGVRRLVLVVAALELLSAVGAVLVAVAVPAITPHVVGVIVVSVVLLVEGMRLGGRIRRRTARAAEDAAPWVSWSPAVVKRKVTRIVMVFVLVTVLATAAIVGLGIAFDEGGELSGTVALVGLAPGLMSASIACMVVSWPLAKDLRRSLGNSYTEQKVIARVVLRGKDDELSEDGGLRAATYARIAASYLPFQIAQLVLLFAGIWFQQVWNLEQGSVDGMITFTRVVVVAYPVLVAVILPMLVVQARRAGRYAAAHAHLLPTGSDAIAAAASPSIAGEGVDRDVQPG